jgi:hypothetical protein
MTERNIQSAHLLSCSAIKLHHRLRFPKRIALLALLLAGVGRGARAKGR